MTARRKPAPLPCMTCFRPFSSAPSSRNKFCCEDCDTSTRPFTGAEIARVKALHHVGLCYSAIAAEINRSPGGVGALIAKLIHAGELRNRIAMRKPMQRWAA